MSQVGVRWWWRRWEFCCLCCVVGCVRLGRRRARRGAWRGGGVGEVFAVDGVAEVLDEVGGDELGDELGAEGGFFSELGRGVGGGVFEAGEQGVGVGLEVAGGGFGGEAVECGESGLVEIDGTGGAGDVFEVGAEGVEQGLEAGGAAGLADFVATEFGGKGGEVCKAEDGFATSGEVGVVFDAEGAYAVEAVVAEDVAVVHGERWSEYLGFDRKLSDGFAVGKKHCVTGREMGRDGGSRFSSNPHKGLMGSPLEAGFPRSGTYLVMKWDLLGGKVGPTRW
jgi:hypothetical protein